MKKTLALLLICLLPVILCGCSSKNGRYTASYWDTFDTQITIIGYAEDKVQFDAACEEVHRELIRLHKIFDSHQAQPVCGVWALNQAQGQPLQVDAELVEVLRMSKQLAQKTGGKFNPALGSVIEIWSKYRSEGVRVPDMEELRRAFEHTDVEDIKIDPSSNTVQLVDPMMKLDLGAVAKGYAVERVAKMLERSMPSFLLDAGGNLRVGDAPLDGRTYWTLGVTDAAAALKGETGVLGRFRSTHLSVVSSGGYERFYEVDGVRYHHIIDPETLMPGEKFLQTTVLTGDSALADCLSTALFLMDYEDGRALVESMEGVDAIWVQNEKNIMMTPGARAMMVDGA